MKSYIYLIFILLTLVSCSVSRQSFEPEKAAILDSQLKDGNYEAKFMWARPLMSNELSNIYATNLLPAISQTGRVNILDAQNFIRKSGDSIDMYLPYFGTRHLSVDIGENNSAISFKGIPKKYTVKFYEKKQLYVVSFVVRRRTETFNVTMQLYPEDRIQLNINCSHRSTIIYEGSFINGEVEIAGK